MEIKNIKSKILDHIVNFLEHNDEHYIELNIFGRTIKPCARCFGKFLGILISFILFTPFVFGYMHIDFYTSFIVSWMFAMPAIIDWSTVKLGLWNGNNKIRFITGFLLGFGITTYLLVMPASLIFKFSTFFIYEFVFALIYIHTKIGIKNAINTFKSQFKSLKSNPSLIYSCECGWGCCCPCAEGCYGGCMNALLCTFLACLTIPCCCFVGKEVKGGE